MNEQMFFTQNQGPLIDEALEKSLLRPLRNFMGNGGKNLRSVLVELGLRLSLAEDNEEYILASLEKLSVAFSVIESIHTGSLIIDDIQDQSEVRRNLPTLHLQHGLPLALNAGNWLYFRALEQIRFLDLPPEKGQELLYEVLRLMTKAHSGQALDLGVKIDEVDQCNVRDLVFSSMELKTGTLFELAVLLGGSLSHAGVNPVIRNLSVNLGVCLQIYDDIGNFLQKKCSVPSKRHEDLRNLRPTWVWAEASTLSPASYLEFKNSLSFLPDETALENWILRNDFRNLLLTNAGSKLRETVGDFEKNWGQSHPKSMAMLKEISNKLENSYV